MDIPVILIKFTAIKPLRTSGKVQNLAMDKTVLIVAAAIFVVSLYFETVSCLNKNETLFDNKVIPTGKSKLSTLLNAHLGRRKRSYIEDGYDLMDENGNFPRENDKWQDMFIILKRQKQRECFNATGHKIGCPWFRPRRNIDNDLSTANQPSPFAPCTPEYQYVRIGRDI